MCNTGWLRVLNAVIWCGLPRTKHDGTCAYVSTHEAARHEVPATYSAAGFRTISLDSGHWGVWQEGCALRFTLQIALLDYFLSSALGARREGEAQRRPTDRARGKLRGGR